MNCKLLLCTAVTILFTRTFFSQEKVNESQKSTKVISIDKPTNSSLSSNGIKNESFLNSIQDEDLNRLISFDFSPFRNYYTNQKVQIENGPVIELFSIEEMLQKNFQFDIAYLENKKGVDFSSITHQLVPIVNIGYGTKLVQISSVLKH